MNEQNQSQLLLANAPSYKIHTPSHEPHPRDVVGQLVYVPRADHRSGNLIMRSDVHVYDSIAGAFIMEDRGGHTRPVFIDARAAFVSDPDASTPSWINTPELFRAGPLRVVRMATAQDMSPIEWAWAKLQNLKRIRRAREWARTTHQVFERLNKLEAALLARAQGTTRGPVWEQGRNTSNDYRVRRRLRVRAMFGAEIREFLHYLNNDMPANTSDLIDAFESYSDVVSVRAAKDALVSAGIRSCDLYSAGLAFCEDCGLLHDNAESTNTHNNSDICPSCADNYQVACEDGQYYHIDDLYYWESDGDYHLSMEEDEDDDDEDEDDEWGGVLEVYSTNAAARYHKDERIAARLSPWAEPLMGIELEVEVDTSVGYGRRSVAQGTKDWFSGYAILKSDGSLTNGFEIVTAPRGLTEHIARFGEWEPDTDLEVTGDQTTCGLHVHLSSHSFSRITLAKYVHFICRPENEELITEIAGRHWNTSDSHYFEGDAQVGTDVLETMRCQHTASRYRAVNMCNLSDEEANRLLGRPGSGRYNTVEVRIFAATVETPKLLGRIEFAHALLYFTRVTSMVDMTESAFRKWLYETQAHYPNLAKMLGIRADKPRVEKPRSAKNTSKKQKQVKAKEAMTTY